MKGIKFLKEFTWSCAMICLGAFGICLLWYADNNASAKSTINVTTTDSVAIKHYQAACIYKAIINQYIENYEDLAKDFPNEDWEMHANNLDELFYEFVDNVDCNSSYIITREELINSYK